MPMQTGVEFSKILLFVGAGYTGAMLFKNIKFSDVLRKLQSLMKELEKSSEAVAAAAQTPRSLDILAATLLATSLGFVLWKGVEDQKSLSKLAFNVRKMDNIVLGLRQTNNILSHLELAIQELARLTERKNA